MSAHHALPFSGEAQALNSAEEFGLSASSGETQHGKLSCDKSMGFPCI
jgi:hypothetical protein